MRVIDVLQGPGDVMQGRRTRSSQDAIQVHGAYGYMKEAGLMAELPHPPTSTGTGRPRPTCARCSRYPRARSAPIGKACANTEVFAVTSEGRRVSRSREVSELYVRGPLMRGYWGQPGKTSQALVPNPFRAECDELATFLKEVHPGTLTIFGGSAPCSPDVRITRGTVSAGEASSNAGKAPKSRYRRESSDSNKQLGRRSQV